MQIVPSDINIDFLSRRRYSAVGSGVFLLISLALIIGKGVQLGIDFTGGIETQIRLEQPVGIDVIRGGLEGIGIQASVQTFGEEDDLEYLVRAPLVEDLEVKVESDRIRAALEQTLGASGVTIERTEVVGPKVGAELREKGLLSILFALGGILIYVWFRFQLGYAFGAIAALVHDVLIVVGLFSLTGKEFNLPTVAAILTIIGYSLNDTVVVFDRIRENRNRARRAPFEPIINRSVNETLSRTILTSVTTLVTVLALLFLTQTGSVINNFAFALLAGVLVGTYSSVFVASPVLLLWEQRK